MSDTEKLAALRVLEAAGKLDQSSLVEAAKDPDHPCHDEIYGEDDATAIHARRLALAGRLIVRFRVSIVISEERTVAVRAFTHVGSRGGWIDGDEAVLNHRVELTEIAVRDARSFVAKHRRLGADTLREALNKALE